MKPTIKTLVYALASLSCLALEGCSTFGNEVAPDSRAITQTYEVDKTSLPSLVQVYDLGGNTIVQFSHADKLQIKVTDVRGQEVPFERMGENIVFKGVQSRLNVSANKGNTTIINTAIRETQEDIAALLAAQRAEYESKLREEIAMIKSELEKMKNQLALEKQREQVMVAAAEKVIVTFKDNSTTFDPSSAEESRLMSVAVKSKDIYIKGYTDSAIPNKPAAQLAQQRAQQAKKYLISKGIDEALIRIDFSSSGGFVANNASPAGKALNRRVEILMS